MATNGHDRLHGAHALVGAMEAERFSPDSKRASGWNQALRVVIYEPLVLHSAAHSHCHAAILDSSCYCHCHGNIFLLPLLLGCMGPLGACSRLTGTGMLGTGYTLSTHSLLLHGMPVGGA